MADTIYASFSDAALAEKAAGALLDHGVRAEDLSLVQNESRYNTPTTVAEDTGVSPDVEGELTGASTSSPGVLGTGSYTPPSANVAGPYADAESDVVDASDSPTAYNPNYRPEEVDDDNFAVTRNEEDYRRERAEYNYDHDDPVKLENAAKHGISTTTAKDAGAAAATGGAIGLGVGAVAALASLLVPGLGLIVGGGALATAVGGMVATTGAGAAVGAITGYLKDQGVEEHAALRYGEAIEKGGAILAVHVPSGDVDEDKARLLLEKYGATNINSYALTENTRPYMA